MPYTEIAVPQVTGEEIRYRLCPERAGLAGVQWLMGSEWMPEFDDEVACLIRALAAMESRANEYADLNNSQARRIAELESAHAIQEERERVLSETWSKVSGERGGVYDDFQGPEDALLQMHRRIRELEALRDSLVGIALQVAALPLVAEMNHTDDIRAVDDVIRHARDTVDDFVLVPTGSI
jgi:hypothetical protein